MNTDLNKREAKYQLKISNDDSVSNEDKLSAQKKLFSPPSPERKLKEQGQPAKAKTPFQCYQKVRYQQLKQLEPDLNQRDLIKYYKKIYGEFKVLSEEEKQKYADVAITDKQRYEKEMEEFRQKINQESLNQDSRISGIRKSKIQKQDQEILQTKSKRLRKSLEDQKSQVVPKPKRRPLSAFFLYVRLNRNKPEYTNMPRNQLCQKLGSEWKELNDEEKQHYNDLAHQEKERYEREMKEVVAQQAKTLLLHENPQFSSNDLMDEENQKQIFGSESKSQNSSNEMIKSSVESNHSQDNLAIQSNQQETRENTLKEQSLDQKQLNLESLNDSQGKTVVGMSVKRPRSSFLLYSLDRRKQLQQMHPGLGFIELAKMFANEWKGLNDEEKQHYNDLAHQEKERYEREMKEVVAQQAKELMNKAQKRQSLRNGSKSFQDTQNSKINLENSSTSSQEKRIEQAGIESSLRYHAESIDSSDSEIIHEDQHRTYNRRGGAGQGRGGKRKPKSLRYMNQKKKVAMQQKRMKTKDDKGQKKECAVALKEGLPVVPKRRGRKPKNQNSNLFEQNVQKSDKRKQKPQLSNDSKSNFFDFKQLQDHTHNEKQQVKKLKNPYRNDRGRFTRKVDALTGEHMDQMTPQNFLNPPSQYQNYKQQNQSQYTSRPQSQFLQQNQTNQNQISTQQGRQRFGQENASNYEGFHEIYDFNPRQMNQISKYQNQIQQQNVQNSFQLLGEQQCQTNQKLKTLVITRDSTTITFYE
eukprot:403342690